MSQGANKVSIQAEEKNEAEISDEIRKKEPKDLSGSLIQWFLSVCPLKLAGGI